MGYESVRVEPNILLCFLNFLYGYIVWCRRATMDGSEGWKVNQIRQWCATSSKRKKNRFPRSVEAHSLTEKKTLNRMHFRINLHIMCLFSFSPSPKREAHYVSKSDLKFNKHLRLLRQSSNRSSIYIFIWICASLRTFEIRRESLSGIRKRWRISRISSWPFSVSVVQKKKKQSKRYRWIGRFHIIGLALSIRRRCRFHWNKTTEKWQWRENTQQRNSCLRKRRRKKICKAKKHKCMY